jgi:hypothetical protein
MAEQDKFDFGGYATKNDIRCTDGRVIRQDAFKHDHGRVVPLVWQHGVSDPSNILGYAILENRADGVYARGVFNDGPNAANAKNLVKHGAINSLSIYANKLGQIGKDVMSGVIREVSLVLSGANPGAKIDTLSFSHGDFDEDEIDEAIIYSGENIALVHSAEKKEEDMKEEIKHEDKEETVGDILATLNDKQKAAVGFLIEELEAEDDDDEDAEHSEEETDYMKTNVFDSENLGDDAHALTHNDFTAIMADAKQRGSFREAFMAHMDANGYELSHAGTYGLDNIGVLFPDAKNVTQTPDWIKRDTGWVGTVLNGTRHTPFSRIRSMTADITPDEARAKGYVTGNEKTEEVFALLSRSTIPTTIYKKQKLDRDDILDITDFDVVAWLRSEMRMMLDEEIGRAVLIGDGRDVASPDKINEGNIRPIYKDAELYAHRVELVGAKVEDNVDEIVRAHKFYKGSGSPTFFTTPENVTDLLLLKDSLGRRLYPTLNELAAALRVSRIVEVEVMENVNDGDALAPKDLYGIIVNLQDYTIGADKGGDINSFDDFDIDYNQYKYLIETRISGALTKPKSAIILEKATPEEPVG